MSKAINITLSPYIASELEYLVELHKKYGAANTQDSVECLVEFVLASIADDSRRPGSWERQLLEMTGLVADCPEHMQYRSEYGKPN